MIRDTAPFVLPDESKEATVKYVEFHSQCSTAEYRTAAKFL